MEDTRPKHITQAVLLGNQIRDLERRQLTLTAERDAQDALLASVTSELSRLWLKVGALKHSVGEVVIL